MREGGLSRRAITEALKETIVELGRLNYKDIDRFLSKYAKRYGTYFLLMTLLKANARIKLIENMLDYGDSKFKTISKYFHKGSRVLSVGCGKGSLELKIAKGGCEVWGVDVNRKILRVAEKLARKISLTSKCYFQKVEVDKLPFKNKFFDIILFSHSLHEIKHKKKSLNEAYRALKQNGIVIILEDKITMTENKLDKLLKSTKFVIEKQEVSYPKKILNNGRITSVIATILRKLESTHEQNL